MLAVLQSYPVVKAQELRMDLAISRAPEDDSITIPIRFSQKSRGKGHR